MAWIFIYSFSVQPPEMWELEIYGGQDSQHSCRACYRGQYMGTMIYGGQCMGGHVMVGNMVVPVQGTYYSEQCI